MGERIPLGHVLVSLTHFLCNLAARAGTLQAGRLAGLL
ncbi:hypothetical protein [Polaromonas sp. CG9_12]|nr:hypothetical protein [Polaromonas sp. CG9_12]